MVVRPGRTLNRSVDDVPSVLRHIQPATLKLHDRALSDLDCWVLETTGLSYLRLLDAPTVFAEVLAAYGRHLYISNRPLYMFVVCITAVARRHSECKHHLGPAWTTATNWRLQEPTLDLPTHRFSTRRLYFAGLQWSG